MNDDKNSDSASSEALSKDKVGGEIYVQNAFKSFGVTKALNGVNLKANFGEIHAIVGGNGFRQNWLLDSPRLELW